MPTSELEQEVRTCGGNLQMDSPEAETVLAILEQRYGRQLVGIDDLEPEQLTSVDSLADLIGTHWDQVRRPRVPSAS